MTNLNMIFHVVVSVYRLVKIWNSLQFPYEFGNGQYHQFLEYQGVIINKLGQIMAYSFCNDNNP